MCLFLLDLGIVIFLFLKILLFGFIGLLNVWLIKMILAFFLFYSRFPLRSHLPSFPDRTRPCISWKPPWIVPWVAWCQTSYHFDVVPQGSTCIHPMQDVLVPLDPWVPWACTFFSTGFHHKVPEGLRFAKHDRRLPGEQLLPFWKSHCSAIHRVNIPCTHRIPFSPLYPS